MSCDEIYKVNTILTKNKIELLHHNLPYEEYGHITHYISSHNIVSEKPFILRMKLLVLTKLEGFKGSGKHVIIFFFCLKEQTCEALIFHFL